MPHLPMLRRATRTSALVLLVLWAAGCVYDHRVTQAILERNRRAKQAEGARIGASRTSTLPAKHTGRVRFYVSAEYRAQHDDWKRRIEQLVESANGVLRPSFALRLEVSELHEWSPSCDQARLDSCLAELASIGTNAPEEWVVGVLGAQPRFTSSFDELGMATLPGAHFVLRDVSDLAEREAIDAAFATFTVERRDEIYQKRKEHKRVAVFLHEWGHTVGGLHTTSSDALLHASYDDRMADFDAENAELIVAALEDRFVHHGGHATLLAKLEATAGQGHSAQERSALLARLRAPAPQATAEAAIRAGNEQPAHLFLASGSEDELLADVSTEDRATYRSSVRTLLAEQEWESLQILLPLIERYPENYAVQHLACGLLLAAQAQADVSTVCPRAQKLAVARERARQQAK